LEQKERPKQEQVPTVKGQRPQASDIIIGIADRFDLFHSGAFIEDQIIWDFRGKIDDKIVSGLKASLLEQLQEKFEAGIAEIPNYELFVPLLACLKHYAALAGYVGVKFYFILFYFFIFIFLFLFFYFYFFFVRDYVFLFCWSVEYIDIKIYFEKNVMSDMVFVFVFLCFFFFDEHMFF